MNRFAGVVAKGTATDERASLLLNAFGDDSEKLIIHHLLPDASIAWCGEDDLASLATDGSGFAATFGFGYSASGDDSPRVVTPDSSASLAAYLLQRGNANPALGLAGAFIALIGRKDGRHRLLGDHTGGRSPFYIVRNGMLAFASHPLTCARLAPNPQIDRSLEDFFLIHGFLPDGRTVYKDVFQVGPGSEVTQVSGSWAVVANDPPASGSEPSPAPSTEAELLEGLHDTMLRCLEEQLPQQPDVGVLLGGFDSALVASMLAGLGKRVHTYSFRYSDSEYNQPHTETLAKFLGCRHTWVDITPESIGQELASYGKRYLQPTNWINYVVQTANVAKQMRDDGLDFAYSGDGCDALFLGYPGTYKRTLTYSRLPRVPDPLVKLILLATGSQFLDRALGHPYRVGMNLVRALGREMPTKAFLSFRILDEVSVDALRNGDDPSQSESVEQIAARLAAPFAGTSIQRLGYAAKAFVSPNKAKMLACMDIAGIRVLSPYMHPHLKRFASGIPDSFLREKAQSDLSDPGKICLMKMATKYALLPDAIIHQPKLAAIDSPIDDWFSGVLRPDLERAFQALPFTADERHLRSLIEPTWAEVLYKRHIGSTRVISDAASLLASYGAFCAALDQRRG